MLMRFCYRTAVEKTTSMDFSRLNILRWGGWAERGEVKSILSHLASGVGGGGWVTHGVTLRHGSTPYS